MLGKLPSQQEIWRLEAELNLAKKRIAEHEETIAKLDHERRHFAAANIELSVMLRASKKDIRRLKGEVV